MDSAFRRSYHTAYEALTQALQQEHGGLDAATLAEEVWAVVRAVDGNVALRRALADPSRDGADKAALATRLLDGRIGRGALQVTTTLVAQRWRTGGDLVDALERLGVEAMLAHAERQGRLGQVEDELFRFSRIVGNHPELQAALGDRRADTAAKGVLVRRLLSVKAAPETVRLAAQGVAGVRGRRFDRVVVAYLDQIAQRQDQVTAIVTTAVPLTAEQHDRLVSSLSRQYGRTVSTQMVIDDGVVGGIRVEIGDEVIDGTVRQRLADARRRMTG